MSGFHVMFRVLVLLNFYAGHVSASRMVATRAHGQVVVKALTEQQQQIRKEVKAAESNMVCRKAEVKKTINADLSVDGVTDINWDTVKKTAGDGMKNIEKSISDLTLDIEDLEQKIKELEEAGRWSEVGESDMNEMLYAACQSFQKAGENTNDCSWAVTGDCGWNDPALMDNFIDPPFDEPIAKFKTAAELKIKGYKRLSVASFKKHCAAVLDADMCTDLCMEFSEVVRTLATDEAAQVLGNTDTLDGLKSQHKTKLQQLASAQAEKESCTRAQAQLEEFRAQLGELSGNYVKSKSAVGRYKRVLRMQQMRLRRQIQILEQKRKLLDQAKAIFAAASQQVIERQAEVDRVQKKLDELRAALQKQLELIAVIEKRITEIDEATQTSREFKEHLSRTLLTAVDTNVLSVHKPLADLKITPERNIAQDFDAAEEKAAPAMKTSVRAVSDYCATEEVSNALTNPLVELTGTEKKLNHICAGQDWNNMIAEAQASVKGTIKEVVDILAQEQSGVVGDGNLPPAGTLKLKDAGGEPEGAQGCIATYKSKSHFTDEYITGGWTVEVIEGKIEKVGKMLMLYQKLGEAAEKMNELWEEATAAARALEVKVKETIEELEKVQELLRQAIAAKQIAKERMDEAQKVVDENEAIKKTMEEHVEKSTETLETGEKEVEAVRDALLKEHRERSAALLEVYQELKGK